MRMAKMLPAGPPPMTQTVAIDLPCHWLLSGLAQAKIGFQTIMQPAPDIVAGRPAALRHFMMAAATAEIAGPAALAGILAVDVPLRQPCRLTRDVDALIERSHGAV